MTDTKSEDNYSIEYWRKRWEDNKTAFHNSTGVNPGLLKHIELITSQKLTSDPVTDPTQVKQNSEKTWFVPLCGKTLDIPYLLSQGFKVFGVEASKLAVETLEKENKLGLIYNDGTKLFSGADGRLQIYVGDFFSCPIEQFGPFDYVWDRGSFIAMEYGFRSGYIEVVQKALRKPDGSWHNFKYLLDTVVYDKSKFAGPPRSASDEDIKECYASWTNCTLLTTDLLPEKHIVRQTLGDDKEAYRRVFLVEPKL